MQQQDENIPSRPVITSSDLATALIFDSGVGGLSVYQEIRQLMPNLHYIYAFDNAGFPYGEKPEEVIIERLVTMIEAIAKQYSIDIIVIACNTASTISLPLLRQRFNIPIVGVVPAIKPAASLTRNGVVGLLATKATINRDYTHELIRNFAQDSEIELIGSSRLVELAEEKLHGKKIDIAELKAIVAPWLGLAKIPDTIVLGCTHFPLLKTELAQVLPQDTLLIDSGEAIARRVLSLLIEYPPKSHTLLRQNIAICSRLDNKAKELIPILNNYGFNSLKEQPI